MRIGFLAILFLLAGTAAAQIKLRLEFSSDGTREVWVAPAPPSGLMPDSMVVKGKAAEITPGSFGPADKLFVLDKTTGNLAVKPLSQISGTWKIEPADFNRIGKVTVRVEHEGKRVETASVSLKSGSFNSTALLDKSSNGEASFFAVPAGSIQATVQYKTSEGASPDPIKQSTDLGLKRSNAEPLVIVSIPDEVATISSAASSETPAQDSNSRGGFGSFGQLLWFLIVVAVVAAAVWFFLKWLKANQDKVQGKLSAMGVEIPGQTKEPSADAYAPQKPIAPPPPEKIILDDASPSAMSPSTPTATANEPRLVSSDGDALPLDEGTLAVGRDAGLGLSLINESTVSRRHAEIVRNGSSVTVKDLGSTNGTYVNGAQVQGEKELRPGDTVQFGAVKFRFEG